MYIINPIAYEKKNYLEGKVFLIPRGNHLRVIHQEDLLYVRAESNYSVFVKDDQTEWTICHTLEYVENLLRQTTFFRCHKSYLINLTKIHEITLNKNELTLEGNVRIPLSRRKRKNFIGALHNIGQSTGK
jgi:two-component system, LytTR family, response regulator